MSVWGYLDNNNIEKLNLKKWILIISLEYSYSTFLLFSALRPAHFYEPVMAFKRCHGANSASRLLDWVSLLPETTLNLSIYSL